MPAHARIPLRLIAAAAIGALLLLGCETERRVISVRGGLAGIEGAQGGDLAESGRQSNAQSSAFANLTQRHRDQSLANAGKEQQNPRSIRINNEDGSVTLILSSPRHVILHLRQTLLDEDRDLLFDQVLSDRAKENYAQAGKDPHEAVEFLIANRREVLKMLQRMPQGELSPGLFMKKIGPNAFRLELNGAQSRGLAFRRLDVVWELGVCKLLAVG